MIDDLDEAVSHLLALRLKVRHSAEGRAIVDRCLALLARAKVADVEMLRDLCREMDVLADDLALRFGAPKRVRVQ